MTCRFAVACGSPSPIVVSSPPTTPGAKAEGNAIRNAALWVSGHWQAGKPAFTSPFTTPDLLSEVAEVVTSVGTDVGRPSKIAEIPKENCGIRIPPSPHPSN
jgi:hypothetical protein